MDERSKKWEAWFDWPMVVAALLVIPVLAIEESNFGEPLDTIGQVLNWGTWLAFVVEAIVMIAVTPKPWQWIRRHPIDVAVIFLSPPLLPSNLAAARLFRLLRVLRLFRLFSARRLLSLEGVRYAAFLAIFVTLIGGAAYSAIETGPDGQRLSAWDGIWWAITTVTTVGYGDNYPTTDAGRMIAIVVMAVGIGFVALITAFVADRLIRQDIGGEIQEQEEEVVRRLESIDARLARLEAALRDRT